MKGSNSNFKMSVPCPVCVNYSSHIHRNRVIPITIHQLQQGETGILVPQYDGRTAGMPVCSELFENSRVRAHKSWDWLPRNVGDTFDPRIRAMQADYMKRQTAKVKEG